MCNSVDGYMVLPYSKFEDVFDNIEAFKKHYLSKTKLNIRKNDFKFIRRTPVADIYVSIIDLEYKGNSKRIDVSNKKFINFLHLLNVKWDDGSSLAIEYLKKDTNYSNAISVMKWKNKINYFSSQTKRIIRYYFDNVVNIWQYDKPDVVVDTKNVIVGLEHFQIDASGKSMHGSIGVVAKKEMEKELVSGRPGEVVVATRHMSNSLNNLWNDFYDNFNAHLKIKEYKSNLQKCSSNKRMTIGFYIEDCTLLGSYCRKDHKGFQPIYIFNLKEFWDMFLDTKGPLFIVFQQTGGNVDDLFFITRHDYQPLKDKREIYSIKDVDECFFNEPNLVGGVINLS